MSKLGNVPHRYARYAEIMFYEDASGWQTFKYGKLGEVTENIRTFALPFENQTYTFKMNFEHDPFNRIQSMLYPDSERVEYGYNLGGMLTRVTGSVTRKYSDLITPNSMQKQGGGFLQGGTLCKASTLALTPSKETLSPCVTRILTALSITSSNSKTPWFTATALGCATCMTRFSV